MKIVEEEKHLGNLFLTANEAKKFFNNDELYIEKYFKNPGLLKFKLCLVRIKQCIWLKEIVQFKEDIKN